MAVIDPRVLAPFRSRADRCRDDSGMRERPTCVVLGVKAGVTPSPKPPVRIFLGTEPAQYRAERIFVWSIERVRDPSRVYEIHLMKELAGFDRRRWLTGFTNYRYAIPHFAEGSGRAIWNDVDEIYLADPAELFDTEMGDHGFLTIPRLGPKKRADSSVMLIDCARMAPIWPLEATQREGSKSLLDRALAVRGLNGELAPEWNSRDEEYVEGRSKLIHYTVLHTQPWQPLPHVFVYQRNPVGEVWYDLEKSADEAGFYVFSAERPSPPYTEMLARLRAAVADGEAGRRASEAPGAEADDVRAAAAAAGAQTILEYGLAKAERGDLAAKSAASRYGVQSVTRTDLAFAAPGDGRPECDGVVCTEVLEYVPDEDVPWVIEDLFAHARHFVYATVTSGPHAKVLPDGSGPRRRPGGRPWWYAFFEAAGARHPEVQWTLAFHIRTAEERTVAHLRKEGPRPDGEPSVWVLTDADPEHTDQSIGLAEALGWPYERVDLRNGALSRLPREAGAPQVDLDRAQSASPSPAWPDLVIAAGPRPSREARRIGERSRGQTRVVQLGREGGQSADPFDITVTYGHSDLPADRRRIETVAPLNPVTSERLARAAEHLPSWFEAARRPRVVLWVGGSTAQHRLDGETALRLARDVRGFVDAAGGSLVAVTSPGTEPDTNNALKLGLGESVHLQQWSPGQWEGPGPSCLAAADAVVVTGGSEFLLAQATATGKPVYIYPLPRRRLGLGQRLARSVETRAHGRPLNRRGTVRPQQGLEYLCARLIERGVISPPHDPDELQQTLIRQGAALPFGEPLEVGARVPLREADEVARRIRRRLGCSAAADGRAAE